MISLIFAIDPGRRHRQGQRPALALRQGSPLFQEHHPAPPRADGKQYLSVDRRSPRTSASRPRRTSS
ncbi:MAG: hypothetical protein MZU97_11105 [Bacillus subtilis]|nr:hypothetical protein [Bacillus subtilis]